jgi:uncharacterized membrane protein YdjX (TVP38/TMEM64 family)
MKQKLYWAIFISCFIIVVGLYFWFTTTVYYNSLLIWSRQNVFVMMLFLINVKILGIVFPPIPGGVVTVAAVPFIGWQRAFIADLIGGLIGSSIAYYLGKKYGNSLLHKLFGEKTITKINSLRIKENREIESIFVLRFLFGSFIAEVICYAAGFLKISFNKFFIGSAIYHFAIGIPAYFFVSNLFGGKNIIFNFVLLLVAIPLFFLLRKRYFET